MNKKLLLVAGTALLGLAISEPAAHAQPINFTYTGKLVTWTVPKNGTYQIVAFGAQGGYDYNGSPYPNVGGLGAEIGGTFDLNAGDNLQIAVGGTVVTVGGGGGGGSFVVGPNNTPLVIAGGGGGGGGENTGQPGLIGPNGGEGALIRPASAVLAARTETVGLARISLVALAVGPGSKAAATAGHRDSQRT